MDSTRSLEGLQRMNYKMVAIDMDGTLLNEKKQVTDKTKEALVRAQLQGIKIVITTGRIFTSAKLYSDYIGLTTPIIACNGAIIKGIGSEDHFQTYPIDKEIIYQAANICEEMNLPYHLYSEDKIYSTNRWELYEFYHRDEIKIDSNYSIVFEDIESSHSLYHLGEEILKFNIWDDDESRIMMALTKIHGIQDAFITSSSPNNIEITNAKATKGNAVKKIAEYFNIRREEVIAIGDSYNDISMIEYAGLGVAMDNAKKDIKDVANFITTSNDEDGIVDVFEKFIF